MCLKLRNECLHRISESEDGSSVPELLIVLRYRSDAVIKKVSVLQSYCHSGVNKTYRKIKSYFNSVDCRQMISEWERKQRWAVYLIQPTSGEQFKMKVFQIERPAKYIASVIWTINLKRSAVLRN